MNVAEIIIWVGRVGCAMLTAAGIAFLIKLVIVDPVRHRRSDAAELDRLMPKPDAKTTAKPVKAVAE